MTVFEATPLQVLGLIEVLNRNGQVVQRLPWNGRHLRIGRAYDNDMIVDDHYVCPHHLELLLDTGRLLARDLGSVNGSYTGPGKDPVQVVELTDGLTIQFGHSQLRYHASGGEVAATWRDTARHGPLAVLGKSWVVLFAAMLAIAALAADSLLESPDKPELLNIAGEMLYPLMAVLLWAGFWSLLNRLMTNRANFHIHLAIALIAMAGLFLSDQLVSLLAFALGWNDSVDWLDYLSQSAVGAMTIYSHLRYAMPGVAARQAMVATAVALILVGTPQIGDVIERNEFSNLPYLEPLLWPPAFRLVRGESIDEFFDQSTSLRETLDKASDK